MRRIYMTLLGRVDRPEDSPEDVGEVLIIDWDTKKVVRRLVADSLKVVETGRSRGANGITWHEDKLYVACREAIVVFDPYNDYELVNRLDLGAPAGFHQLKTHEGLLYVVCTGGNSFKVIKNDQVIDVKNMDPNSVTDSLHFNSIAWDSKGDQYHLYMSKKQIVNYTRQEVLKVKLGILPHDICFIDDAKFLYTNSGYGELRLYDIEKDYDAQLFRRIAVNPRTPIAGGYQMRGFMRGVDYDRETGSVFVATAPGILYELETQGWNVVETFVANDILGAAVYDILLDPRDWNFREAPRMVRPPQPPVLPVSEPISIPLPPPTLYVPSFWDKRVLQHKTVYSLLTYPFKKLYRRFEAWNSYNDLED